MNQKPDKDILMINKTPITGLNQVTNALDFNARGGSADDLALYLAMIPGRPSLRLVTHTSYRNSQPRLYKLLEVKPGEKVDPNQFIEKARQAIEALGIIPDRKIQIYELHQTIEGFTKEG